MLTTTVVPVALDPKKNNTCNKKICIIHQEHKTNILFNQSLLKLKAMFLQVMQNFERHSAEVRRACVF